MLYVFFQYEEHILDSPRTNILMEILITVALREAMLNRINKECYGCSMSSDNITEHTFCKLDSETQVEYFYDHCATRLEYTSIYSMYDMMAKASGCRTCNDQTVSNTLNYLINEAFSKGEELYNRLVDLMNNLPADNDEVYKLAVNCLPSPRTY